MPPEIPAQAPASATAAPHATAGLLLQVNGEARTLTAACNIDELLRQLEIDRRRVAVAVNRDVVPRSAFTTHQLRAGDRVEILEAVGGG